jgi:hypothetical protein
VCHADQQWTEALPLVLLGIRTFFKTDLQASVVELVYGEPEDSRRDTDPYSGPSGTSASHHTAAPSYGPPQTISGSAPRLLSHIRAQGPPKLHACFSPSGRNTPGSGAPLQRPLPGPLTERENTASPCERQARHRVCRQGQASLRVERGRLWEHHFQPLGQRNPRHSTSSSYTVYTLWSPHSLPRTLKHLSNILRGGVGTSHKAVLPQVPVSKSPAV